MRTSKNLENNIPSDTYWRVQLVFIKVQTYSSSRPPLEYNQDLMSSANKVGYGLFNQSGIYINIMQFQISPRTESRYLS